jgi:hypothetical protein
MDSIITEKRCTKCGEIKSINMFTKNIRSKDGFGFQCKGCSKERLREWNQLVKIECINHYGGCCLICGNMNIHHLTIDHINNDGASHRKEIKPHNLYIWLKHNNYPNGFQVLCWNHNEEKYRYGVMSI